MTENFEIKQITIDLNDDGYIARIVGLPDIFGFGETPEDALKDLKETGGEMFRVIARRDRE